MSEMRPFKIGRIFFALASTVPTSFQNNNIILTSYKKFCVSFIVTFAHHFWKRTFCTLHLPIKMGFRKSKIK